jgi:OTU domain-containing protein 3
MSLGLRLKEVGADGNCFFRALCDQRWGDETDHLALRRQTIEYMEANRDSFEPFIEDDEKWAAYIERMSEDGTWAGNMVGSCTS